MDTNNHSMNRESITAGVITGVISAGSLASWVFVNGGMQFLVLLCAVVVGYNQVRKSKAERQRAEAELREWQHKHNKKTKGP